MNPQAGNHQEDYPPREVEAARRVMTELWQVLGEYRDAMVLIGGWVPELLLPTAIPPHTGSLDVDVLLDPGPLRDEDRYADLVQLLKARGYAETDKPFKLAKDVTVDEDGSIRVEVDFLLPKKPKTKRGKILPEFRAIEADGARFTLNHKQPLAFQGRMPDGRQNTITLQVASLVAFIVMKAFALDGRDKTKDAYDLYFCLKNAPEGPKGLARALSPDRENPEVQHALKILASKYGSPDDYGPGSVVLFMNPNDPDERRFLARDAHAQMRVFLESLNPPSSSTPRTLEPREWREPPQPPRNAMVPMANTSQGTREPSVALLRAAGPEPLLPEAEPDPPCKSLVRPKGHVLPLAFCRRLRHRPPLPGGGGEAHRIPELCGLESHVRDESHHGRPRSQGQAAVHRLGHPGVSAPFQVIEYLEGRGPFPRL